MKCSLHHLFPRHYKIEDADTIEYRSLDFGLPWLCTTKTIIFNGSSLATCSWGILPRFDISFRASFAFTLLVMAIGQLKMAECLLGRVVFIVAELFKETRISFTSVCSQWSALSLRLIAIIANDWIFSGGNCACLVGGWSSFEKVFKFFGGLLVSLVVRNLWIFHFGFFSTDNSFSKGWTTSHLSRFKFYRQGLFMINNIPMWLIF